MAPVFRFLLVLCLLTAAIPIAQADDGPFRISQSTFYNSNPVIVGNSRNGDILVVWTETRDDDYTYGRVYAVRFMRNDDGSFSAGAPTLVSQSDLPCDSGTVAYNADSNVYFVVWIGCYPDLDDVEYTRIFARELNNKGNPEGSAMVLIDSGHRDYRPYVQSVPKQHVVGGSPGYLLQWSRNPRWLSDAESNLGLWSVQIGFAGTSVSGPRRIMLGLQFGNSLMNAWTNDLVWHGAVNQFYTGVYHSILQDNVPVRVSSFGRLTPKGEIIGWRQQGDINVTAPLVQTLSASKLLLLWRKTVEPFGYVGQRYKATLLPVKTAMTPVSGKITNSAAIAQVPGLNGAFQVCASSSSADMDAATVMNFFLCTVNAKGKYAGTPRFLFKATGAVDAIRMIPVKGSNALFVVWSREMENNKRQEIWGDFISVP